MNLEVPLVVLVNYDAWVPIHPPIFLEHVCVHVNYLSIFPPTHSVLVLNKGEIPLLSKTSPTCLPNLNCKVHLYVKVTFIDAYSF